MVCIRNSWHHLTFKSFWNHHLLSWLETQWCLKGLRSCLVILSAVQKLAKVCTLLFKWLFRDLVHDLHIGASPTWRPKVISVIWTILKRSFRSYRIYSRCGPLVSYCSISFTDEETKFPLMSEDPLLVVLLVCGCYNEYSMYFLRHRERNASYTYIQK